MSKKPKKQSKPNYKKQQRARSKPGNSEPPANTTAAAKVQRQAFKPAAPSPVVSLEPLAPLIVRSGRPFDDQAGADAARFPPPSTLAGCLRTAWARANAKDFGPELAELTVAGPLLARPADDGTLRLLAPKPADAHYFGHDTTARCIRAEPMVLDEGCGSDLPEALLPLQLTEVISGKTSQGPAWWDWEDLLAFRLGLAVSHKDLSARGWSPPAGERRTHVGIQADTLAADSGRLFQTEGLDFAPDNPGLDKADTPGLRLLARCAEPLRGGLAHLGGERRLARMHAEPETLWPTPPADWLARIQKAGGLTLTLLTPACFSAGYRPGWLDTSLIGAPPQAPGLRLQLVAAAVERWQPHSGWDLAERQPRPTRKLVAAGATYWLRLLETPAQEALKSLWLSSLCDLEQDRRDGYGLVLPAPWTPSD